MISQSEPTPEATINVLKSLMKSTKETKPFKRYQVVYLHLQRYEVNEIVLITGVSKSNVYDYIHLFEEKGIDGLDYKGYPGASPRLDKAQKCELKKIILERRPHDLGFPSKYNWTLKIIVAYVEKTYGEKYTLPGMSKILHEMGLSYTKATYTLTAADEDKQRVFREETLPGLKKNWNLAI